MENINMIKEVIYLGWNIVKDKVIWIILFLISLVLVYFVNKYINVIEKTLHGIING